MQNTISNSVSNILSPEIVILSIATILIIVALACIIYLIWPKIVGKKHHHSHHYYDEQENAFPSPRDYEREIKELNKQINELNNQISRVKDDAKIQLNSKESEINACKKEYDESKIRHANEISQKESEISSLNREIQNAKDEQRKIQYDYENKIASLKRSHAAEIETKEAEHKEVLLRERKNAEIQCQQYKEAIDKFFPSVPASIREIFENWKLEIRQNADGSARPIVLALLAQLVAWKAVAQTSDIQRQQDCIVVFGKNLVEWCNENKMETEAAYEMIEKFAQAFNENLIPQSSFTRKIWLPAFESPYKASRMISSIQGEKAGRVIGLESWGIISEKDELPVRATVILG